ncbi:MAG: RraA family protein [Opitutaceae bacterium]|nr:RraA family protein [Opitutaceae bacterium]
MTSLWKNDSELFALAKRELFTAVVGDIMDVIGLRQQFLSPKIRPLQSTMVTIGRAMTVLESDTEKIVESGHEVLLEKPFGLMLEALDDLKTDEIYICAGASPSYALWGELMSIRAMKCGAVGAIMDGYSRDTKEILGLNFPTFSYGPYAQDQAPRGKVVDFRVPLSIGGVEIQPGDILFGDIDGVCVIPQAAEEEVFSKALEKARGEKTVRTAIENGMTAKEAFETYGIM